jgi:hypothetical protein
MTPCKKSREACCLLDEIAIYYKMPLNNQYDTRAEKIFVEHWEWGDCSDDSADEECCCAGEGRAGPKEAHERVEDVKGV